MRYYLPAMFSLTLILMSCGAARDIKDSTKNLENGIVKGTENLIQAMDKLDKIDPAGLKQLMNEREDLRVKLFAVQEKIRGAGNSEGVVLTSDRLVRIRITGYSGGFKVNGYCDTLKNQFWYDKILNNRDIGLQVDYSSVYNNFAFVKQVRDFQKIPIARNMEGKVSDIVNKIEGHVVTDLKQSVDAAFASYLRSADSSPTSAITFIDLNSSFLNPGEHKIVLSVTPISQNWLGRWSLEGDLVSVKPDGEIAEVIKSFTFSDNERRLGPLGVPLPDFNTFIVVQLDKKSKK